MGYENWKIKVEDYEEYSEEYTEVANWCNNGSQYTIIEQDGWYMVVPVPLPTNEEIRQMREEAYTSEVDPITSHISRLKDTTPMTPEVEAEIADLIVERDVKFQEIQERYPYNE